jgi:hypothetical protein
MMPTTSPCSFRVGLTGLGLQLRDALHGTIVESCDASARYCQCNEAGQLSLGWGCAASDESVT